MSNRERLGFGSPTYPSATASRKGSRVKRTSFRRCKNCGMPNDTQKVGVGEGDTLEADSETPPNYTVNGGCRFCGSNNWLPGNPKPLENDERLKHPRRRK